MKILPKDVDLVGADKAIKRAAKKAHELAERTQTPFYIYENGKVVDALKRKGKGGQD